MSAKLWSGRFGSDITDDVLNYTLTVDVDLRLAPFDIWGSTAHVLMLEAARIISAADAAAIAGALVELRDECERGQLRLDPQLEDVHLNLESMVIQRVGPAAGGRMHTARSRNDQVMTAMRMYLREEVLSLVDRLAMFVEDLCARGRAELNTVIPGYTHSQPAQPISVGSVARPTRRRCRATWNAFATHTPGSM